MRSEVAQQLMKLMRNSGAQHLMGRILAKRQESTSLKEVQSLVNELHSVTGKSSAAVELLWRTVAQHSSAQGNGRLQDAEVLRKHMGTALRAVTQFQQAKQGQRVDLGAQTAQANQQYQQQQCQQYQYYQPVQTGARHWVPHQQHCQPHQQYHSSSQQPRAHHDHTRPWSTPLPRFSPQVNQLAQYFDASSRSQDTSNMHRARSASTTSKGPTIVDAEFEETEDPSPEVQADLKEEQKKKLEEAWDKINNDMATHFHLSSIVTKLSVNRVKTDDLKDPDRLRELLQDPHLHQLIFSYVDLLKKVGAYDAYKHVLNEEHVPKQAPKMGWYEFLISPWMRYDMTKEHK